MRLVATRAAAKLGLCWAILFLAVAALSAGTTGVMRINGHQQHSSPYGFVFKEFPQLRKCPTVQNGTLLSPGLDPSANPVEVFNRDAATGAFSFSNDLLTYHVVYMPSETAFFARELFEAPLRRAGLLFLKFGSQSAVAMPDRFDMRAGMPDAVRIGRDIGDTKIDTKKIAGFNRSFIRQVYRTNQVKLALAIDQICLSLDSVKPFFLVLAIDQGNDHTAFRERPQTHAIQALETEDPFVIRDGTVWLEHRTGLFVSRKAFHGFTDSAYCHLRRQAETRTNLGVGQFVDRRLAEYASIESFAGCECRGFVGSLHRFEQASALFSVRQNLQLERQFHYSGVYHSRTENAIPLPPEGGSLLAQLL